MISRVLILSGGVQHAKELLVKTNCKINDIPMKVGFSNQSYFSRVFKESVGLTPGNYRDYKRQSNQ